MPLPLTDFDPTESGVPWRLLTERGHRVVFATPEAMPARADERMLDGRGLGLLAPMLRADKNGRAAYEQMALSPEFQAPIAWDAIDLGAFDALLLPGGHAVGMRPYLESEDLQGVVGQSFQANKIVAAICHGVVLAARSNRDLEDTRSVLHDRKTTALLKTQEMAAWALTFTWLGDYYRTYQVSVQEEVTACLAAPDQFITGPTPLKRDSVERPELGFCVRDRNYLSARWPGDAHRFALELIGMLG
jgi:protease I